MDRFPPHYIELLSDALLKVYWFKKSFQSTLRRCGVAESYFAGWTAEETKRDLLNRVLPQLEATDAGVRVINQLADTVLDQKTFPDLERVEDSALKIRQAKGAIAALREYRQRQSEKAQNQREQAVTRQRALKTREELQQQQQRIEKLSQRLDALALELGTQDAGYKFEEWFYDLVSYFEVESRRPYKIDGRQIDGSVTVDGTTYLVELKFTAEQSGATDIDTFYRKVSTKADNTMGIMVSISGYSSVAQKEASRERTPLLLLDHSHLYFLLTGSASFAEVISRVRRHSCQTGQAYLSVQDFGG